MARRRRKGDGEFVILMNNGNKGVVGIFGNRGSAAEWLRRNGWVERFPPVIRQGYKCEPDYDPRVERWDHEPKAIYGVAKICEINTIVGSTQRPCRYGIDAEDGN